MIATHTGRLKNIGDLITDIKLNSKHDSVLKNFIIFLNDNEGAIIELEETAIGWRNEDFGFRDSMFSKIEEIKPKIEIPETPFWVEDEEGKKQEITFVNHRYESTHSICKLTSEGVEKLFSSGYWTICDEPKKKMRAWTDEELFEYFKGGYPMLDGDILFFPARLVKGGVSIYHCDILEYLEWSKVRYRKDKNGNKFEKEV